MIKNEDNFLIIGKISNISDFLEVKSLFSFSSHYKCT